MSFVARRNTRRDASRRSSSSRGRIFGRQSRQLDGKSNELALESKWLGAQKSVDDFGDTVTSVCVSCDAKLFVAGGTNKKAIVYRTSNGTRLAEFTADSGINAVVCSGGMEDARLVVGTFGGWVRVYSVKGEKEEAAVKNIDGNAVHCMSFAASVQRLAVGGKGDQVGLYQLTLPGGDPGAASGGGCELTLLCRFKTVGSLTTSVSLDAGATLLAAGGEACVVQLWRAASAASGAEGSKPFVQFRTSSVVHSLALARSAHLAVGTTEHTEIYRILSEESSGSGDAQGGVVCEPLLILDCPAQQGGVSFSETGSRLAVGGHQLVSVFDYATGGMLEKLHHDGRVRCVALSHDGACLVVGGFDRKVRLHGLQLGTQLVSLASPARGSVVRSVHLSSDSTVLAMGVEAAGAGSALLYDAAHGHVLLHEWKHEKPVWATRLSPDSESLAVGGYDMKLTVYSTHSFAQLQQIAYTPLGGPAFIWSLQWSASGTRLVVGCWNHHVYVYQCGGAAVAGGADEDGGSPPPLTPLAEVSRSDRVYAVDIDAAGDHIVVGGRDKAVAMFDVSGAPKAEVLEWDLETDDFVYTVALTDDMECASPAPDLPRPLPPSPIASATDLAVCHAPLQVRRLRGNRQDGRRPERHVGREALPDRLLGRAVGRGAALDAKGHEARHRWRHPRADARRRRLAGGGALAARGQHDQRHLAHAGVHLLLRRRRR